MKKTSFLTLILIILLISSISVSAFSNDDYAVEVVLNKPGVDCNFYNLDKLDNIKIENNKYIAPSQYNQELAAIFYLESGLTCGKSQGLIVRLQLPTKISETNVPYVKFISNLNKDMNTSQENFKTGWDILCSNQQCTLKKERTSLDINQISKSKYEVTLESSTGLLSPSAGLKCFSKYGNILCLSSSLEKEMNDALENIVAPFKEFLTSYNIIIIGTKTENTIIPAISLQPDWREAMRQELVNLQRKGVAPLENKDIEEIVALTQQGKAGRNLRIVYDSDINSYIYYYKTSLPILSQELNSAPFVFPITGSAVNPVSNPYYLVPIIITSVLFVVFFFLIVLAKLLTRERKRKLKPTTSLLSQGQFNFVVIFIQFLTIIVNIKLYFPHIS